MKKIIIVDDSESYRSRIKRDLEANSYTVIEAINGEDGVKLCKQHLDADAILVDMNMPGMDGLRMISILRQEDDFQKVPVLIVTTESSAKQKSQAKELGVIAWIQKPISGRALVKTLNKLL